MEKKVTLLISEYKKTKMEGISMKYLKDSNPCLIDMPANCFIWSMRTAFRNFPLPYLKPYQICKSLTINMLVLPIYKR